MNLCLNTQFTKRLLLVQLTCISLLASCFVFAQAPLLINYQGRVSQSGETAAIIDELRFVLRSEDDDLNSLWEEFHENVEVRDGTFQVFIGSGQSESALTDSVFALSPQLWLEVHINGEELAPRTRIGSIPLAIHARTAAAAIRSDSAEIAMHSDNASTLRLVSADSTASLIIDDNGNLGLNTPTPKTRFDFSEMSGVAIRLKPDVSDSAISLDGFEHNDLLIGTAGQTDDPARARHFMSFGYTDDHQRTFAIGSADDSDFSRASFVPHLTVESGGNVGIGTNDPQNKFHVNGSTILGGHVEVEGNDFRLGTNNTRPVGEDPLQRALVHDNNDELVINFEGDFEGGTIIQGKGWSTNFYVSSAQNGNIGIGTSDPQYRLQVEGDIHATGKITAGVECCGSLSDRRLKREITPLGATLTELTNLNGIKFKWKKDERSGRDTSDIQIGVIAQDVETVYPELVDSDKDGYKRVDYPKLTAVLIEAVKELKAANDSLEERIVKLEANLRNVLELQPNGE